MAAKNEKGEISYENNPRYVNSKEKVPSLFGEDGSAYIVTFGEEFGVESPLRVYKLDGKEELKQFLYDFSSKSDPKCCQIYDELLALQHGEKPAGSDLISCTDNKLGFKFSADFIPRHDGIHNRIHSFEIVSSDAYDKYRDATLYLTKKTNIYDYSNDIARGSKLDASDADFVNGNFEHTKGYKTDRRRVGYPGYAQPDDAPFFVAKNQQKNYYSFDVSSSKRLSACNTPSNIVDYMEFNAKDAKSLDKRYFPLFKPDGKDEKYKAQLDVFMKTHTFEDDKGNVIAFDKFENLPEKMKSLALSGPNANYIGKDEMLLDVVDLKASMAKSNSSIKGYKKDLQSINAKIADEAKAVKDFEKKIAALNEKIAEPKNPESRSKMVDAAFGNIKTADDTQKSGGHDVTE